MARLYLVRRSLESFVGPMSLPDLKIGYQRMIFGAQDEVAGHCGPWVTIENGQLLAKTYPEVAKVLLDENPEGWRGSDHGIKRLSSDKNGRSDLKESRRTLVLAVVFLTIAICAALAAMYLASGGAAFSSKLVEAPLPITVAQAHVLLERPDPAEFVEKVGGYAEDLVTRSSKSKEAFLDWIPYLRALAFHSGGQIDGLSPKLLRGVGASAAPIDCSEKTWRRRWRESTKLWAPFVSGKQIVRAHWSRLLAWDPHWIRRREPRGWIFPHNYFEGCLISASRALSQVKAEKIQLPGAERLELPEVEFQAIQHRLQWLVEIAAAPQATVSPPAPEKDNVLSLWTCLEAEQTVIAVSRCYEASRLAEPALAYADERLGWNLVRVALKQGSMVEPALASELQTRQSRLLKGDSLTRLEYGAELKALRLLPRSEHPTSDPDGDKTPADYPDVNISK